MAHANVELLEIIKADLWLNRCSLVFSLLISLLGVSEFLQLFLDDLILNLLEEQLWLTELSTRFEQVCAAQLGPFESWHVDHLAQFLRRERQEWFESDGEVGNQLEGDIQDSLHTLRIGLPNLPRLTFCDVFITDAGEVHSLFLSLTEFEYIEILLYLLLHVFELSNSLLIYLLQFAASRNYTAPIFLSELESTVYEVTINSYQFRVVALLEILPCEVVVLGLRSIGCQYIAQNILLAREIYEILVQPDCPVTRGRNLIILKIQELVGRHVVWQDIVAVCLQHSREDDAVEHDVVLTDEVNETSLRILPPFLPCAPFLRLCIAEFLGI